MAFVQKNQHCYCAPSKKLSFFDIVDTFDAGSLEGGDKMALGGYAELVEYYVKKWEGRQIIVNQAVVESVQWKEGECIVGYRKKKSSSGSKSVRRLVQMHAHSVICTLPLGVLQEKKDLFTPPLPEPKLNAINKLKMGLENRVLLRFEKCFWPETDHFLRSLVAPHFKILNLHAYGDHDNILMLFVPPPDSDLMESMTDEQIKLWALNDLKKIFNKGKKLPALLEYRITRWRSGEEYSRGSYSYIPVGASIKDVEALAVPEDGLHFAGEAVSVTDMQMTHGAMRTGVEAAERVLKALDARD